MITAVSCAVPPVSTQLSSHTLDARSGERRVDTMPDRTEPARSQLLGRTLGNWARGVSEGRSGPDGGRVREDGNEGQDPTEEWS
jgi:hypothetical protein